MNILLINHYAGSNKHGMEYRPFYLAREWVRLSHQVTIVAASFSHLRSQAPRLTGQITVEEIEGIQYIWLKTPRYQGNGIGRVFNMLAFIGQLLRYYRQFVKDNNPDVVIASSTYPLDIYPAYNIAKQAQAKLIFEVHDLWPLSPMELGGMPAWHPFIVVMQQAENFAYRLSDCVVSLLPKADSYMQEHGMAADKFIYLPNGVDVAEWKSHEAPLPEQYSQLLTQLKQSGRFLVGYTGAHGLANVLSTLIDAALLLRNQPVTFILVGQGPEKSFLQQKVLQLNLDNVIFLPPVSKTSIPSLLAAMDALFIGLQKKAIFRFGVSPNKLMDYMMAAKPVIHAIEAGNDLVAQSNCGISVAPENPEAIAEAVEQLLTTSLTERETMGMNGKAYILAHHDYRVLAQQFLNVVSELL